MQDLLRFSDLPDYAFPRLRTLLENVKAPEVEVPMHIGEPTHDFPDFVDQNACLLGAIWVNHLFWGRVYIQLWFWKLCKRNPTFGWFLFKGHDVFDNVTTARPS